LDEIEHALALDVTPASWPIGMGRDFLGTYDLFADAFRCSSAVFTTGSPSRCGAAGSTTRNCRGYCRKPCSRTDPRADLIAQLLFKGEFRYCDYSVFMEQKWLQRASLPFVYHLSFKTVSMQSPML
jgi:hypothetical protein